MNLLAIDPGPTESAYVLYSRSLRKPFAWSKLPNAQLLAALKSPEVGRYDLAVEKIASYGMAVGADVFETCVWSGRFIEAWEGQDMVRRFGKTVRVTRVAVKTHVCHSAKAKDANVRAALVDRYGGKDVAIGRKASPGVLYGLTGDCWAALGVAVTVADQNLQLLQDTIGGEL